MMSTEQKWKRYEKLVAQVQATLAPDAKVTHNEKFWARTQVF